MGDAPLGLEIEVRCAPMDDLKTFIFQFDATPSGFVTDSEGFRFLAASLHFSCQSGLFRLSLLSNLWVQLESNLVIHASGCCWADELIGRQAVFVGLVG